MLRIEIYGAFYGLLKRFGFKTGSGKKEIPDVIFNLPKDVLREFLAGYFEGDGTIYVKTKSKTNVTIAVTTKSEKLANGLSYLFALLNIPVSIHPLWNKARGTNQPLTKYWNVSVITRDGYEEFRKLFNGRVQRKSFPLLYRKLKNPKDSSGYDRIPNIGLLLYRTLKRLASKSIKQLTKEILPGKNYGRLREYAKGKHAISCISLRDMVTNLNQYPQEMKDQVERLEAFAYSDVFWDPIVEIKRVKSTTPYVYDLTVEGNKNFVAGFGGIVIHNTSMANFTGRLFDKPVVILRESFTSTGSIEKFFEGIASKLKLNPEALMRNLVDGVNVEYSQTGKTVTVKAEINQAKYPEAEKPGEIKRKPIDVFSVQVNDQMDPEDILGYAVDHPAVLGLKPPHVIKTGRFAGADLVILDEIFMSPRLLSKLHHALNEKVVDTTIGPVEVKPLTVLLATNYLNEFYMTNLRIINEATTDRYALSVRSMPPSIQEILVMSKRWRRLNIKRHVPVELIYEARKLLGEVKIPDEFMVFCLALISHLSRCYFSTAKSNRTQESRDPFEGERDCSLCVYRDAGVCSKANIGKVRAIIRLEEAIKAHALINCRKEADQEDLEFALLTVLPHRLAWNDKEYLSEHGGMFTATKTLVEEYAQRFASQISRIREVEELIRKPDPKKALELKAKYRDTPIVRALLDEIIDMMKESARKKGDRATLEALEPKLNITQAIEALKKHGGS